MADGQEWEKKAIVMHYSARGGSCDQACQNGYKSGLPSAAISFISYIYIYICLNSKGTCTQFFKNFDRKNNRTFSIESKRSMFLGQTVPYTKCLALTHPNIGQLRLEYGLWLGGGGQWRRNGAGVRTGARLRHTAAREAEHCRSAEN